MLKIKLEKSFELYECADRKNVKSPGCKDDLEYCLFQTLFLMEFALY